MNEGDTYSYNGEYEYEYEFEFNYEHLLNYTDAYIFTDDANVTSPIEVQQVEKFLVPVVFTFIFFIGLLGNSLVVYIVLKRPDMRTVTNMYLANLAVVDLLFLITCVPLTSAGFALTYWPFGLFFCRFENYCQSVCLAVSVFTLLATSVDRFYAIVHPVRTRTSRTSRRAKAVIFFIWCTSIVIMIPRIFIYHQEEYFNVFQTRTYCLRRTDNLILRQIDTLLMFVVMFVIPQLFLGVFHVRIIKQLWTSVRPGFRATDIALSGLKTRRKIAKILVAITIAFGIGWLPIHIVRLHEDFTGSGDTLIFRNREIFALCFSFGANSVNPIIYTLVSGKFRKYFKSVLCCRYGHDRTVHVQPDVAVNIQRETAPLRLESVFPANEVSLPQPREQVFVYPLPLASTSTSDKTVHTTSLTHGVTTSDLTTIV